MQSSFGYELKMNTSIYTEKTILNAANALTCALKHRDAQTQLHSDRVGSIAVGIGEEYGLEKQDLAALGLAGSLHDIGKIGIPDSILLKNGSFTKTEREEMQHHSMIGSKIVGCLDLEESQLVALAVRHHHENVDGTGYPDGLCGEEIPVLSRIVAIADCYDAITSQRPYHDSRSHEETITLLKCLAPGKFDPMLFQIFLAKNE